MLKKLSNSYVQETASDNQKNTLSRLQPNSGDKDITASQAREKIKESFATTSIGPIQKKNVLTVINSLDELEAILKRKITYINDITIADYQRIMAVKGIRGALFLKSINHPITVRSDREYGWQESEICKDGRFYYLVSYDIAMMDIDNPINHDSNGENMNVLQYVENKALEHRLSVRVYRTFNGYHVFITNIRIHYEHNSDILEILSNEFKSDIYYKVFCQRFGYKVRLNRKIRPNNQEDIVAQYVCKFGDVEENKSILQYLSIHDKLVSHHTDCDDPYSGDI